VIVLGHQAEALRASIESTFTPTLPLQLVVNHRYQLANGVSLLAASEHVSDRFIVSMADHVFGAEVMTLAAAHHPPQAGASLLVDYKLETIFDMDDATKVLASGRKLTKIGKQLTEYNCIDTGLFVCSRALLEALGAVYRDQGDASLSAGVQRLAAAGRMTVVDIGSGFWQDIDTPAMLEHAERRLAQLEETPLRRGVS
jgi:choline kinase